MNIQNSLLQAKINSGIELLKNENLIEALKIFNELKKNKKTKIIGLFFIGIIHTKNKEYQKAKRYFKEVLNLDPKHQDGNLNLGLVHFEEKNYEIAIFYFDQVIKVNKNHIMANYHKGLSYFFVRKIDKAINYFQNCIQIDKNFMYSYLNLGHIYLRLKKFGKASENFNNVLEIDPNNYGSKFNLAWCFFATSDLTNGFKYYEFRKEKTKPKQKTINVNNKFNSKEWHGENINSKKILIISEQGIGDNIQFFRYLYSIKDNYNAEIIFYTDKNLVYLFKDTPFKIVHDLKYINKIDYHQHLLSLPGIFYNKNKKIKECINYITENKINNDKWKNKLNKFQKPIIAINWQGDKNFLSDDTRSINLLNFKDILKLNKYNFISLQKNFGSEQIKLYNYTNLITDLSSEIDLNGNTFEDTISILNNIDALITPDTALAHLGGTLGVKTYLLLSFNHDWRWYLDDKFKYFYPNIKVIEQNKANDWEGVFKKLEKLLQTK